MLLKLLKTEFQHYGSDLRSKGCVIPASDIVRPPAQENTSARQNDLDTQIIELLIRRSMRNCAYAHDSGMKII